MESEAQSCTTKEKVNHEHDPSSYGLWHVPVGYKTAPIGAHAQPGVNPDLKPEPTGVVLKSTSTAEHAVSLELPDCINEFSLYPCMPPSSIPTAAGTHDEKHGMTVEQASNEDSGGFHVDGEDDPMGVDAAAWENHGYSLPAPMAFDGSATTVPTDSSIAPRSQPAKDKVARLLSTEDINIHSASTTLVECL